MDTTKTHQEAPAQLDFVEAYLWIRRHMPDAVRAAAEQDAKKR